MTNLPKVVGSRKKRVGRGYGSGKGGHTTGRGQKGQKSRTKIGVLFEGVKVKKSLLKRLPFQRGKGKNKQSPSNLLSIAIVLILVGFMNFGENRSIGNILLGSGVLLSAIFIYINYKKRNE